MLFVRLVIVVTLALLIPIVVIRMQPETRPELEQLILPPPDCAMPCFLGIRIGQTNSQEAMAILNDHPWVSDVVPATTGSGQTGTVYFEWSVDAPKLLGGFRSNTLELGYRTERVESITLYLFAPTGDVWRLLESNHTLDGRPLSDFIRVDGANCQNTPYDYYTAAPQRLLYRPFANEHPTPYVPVRERPRALRC